MAAASVLAISQREPVLVVQAGGGRPEFQPPAGVRPSRGLPELVHDLYLRDAAEARSPRPELGDWIEILAAQDRSGELAVRAEGETFQLRFVRGSIRAIASRAPNGHAFLTGRDLLGRASDGIVRLIEAEHPDFHFTEHPGPAHGPGSARPGRQESPIDLLFRGCLRDHLRHPFLDRRLADCRMDTPIGNLKLLPAAGGGAITAALRRPLEFLLERIGRGFGVVLIDAAPVDAGGPTAVLAGITDAVLLVASSADTDSAAVLRAVDELRRGGTGLVGVLPRHAGAPAGPGRPSAAGLACPGPAAGA